jgi:hypothetical protein
MRQLSLDFIVVFAALFSLVWSWDIGNENDRHGCQAYSKNPLDGCDQKKTLFVDAVSNKSKFKTVQSGGNSKS